MACLFIMVVICMIRIERILVTSLMQIGWIGVTLMFQKNMV